MADEASGITPPRKKKLPFKPTALHRAAPPKPTSSDGTQADGDKEDDGLALFRRSKELAPIVAAERDRKLKRKQKKMEVEAEFRRLSAGGEQRMRYEDPDEDGPDDKDEALNLPGSSEVSPSQKRSQRRVGLGDELAVTDESMTGLGDSFSGPSSEPKAPSTQEHAGRNIDDLVTPPPSKRSRLGSSSSQRHRHAMADDAELALDESPSARLKRSHSKPTPHIQPDSPINGNNSSFSHGAHISVISDDDDDEAMPLPGPSRRRESSVEVIEDPVLAQEDDDDEFAEYVRQAEEQRSQQLALQNSASSSSAPRETVEILVTSSIPGAKPFCAKFTFDKTLRLLRDTWLATQIREGVSLTSEEKEGAVLTWRKKRVYISSSLLSLGIRPQGNGRVAVDGNPRNGLNPSATRVHMEAWTPQLFADMEHEEELRRKREAGELPDEDEDAEQEAEEPPEPEVKIRVILRARDLEDVKLTVRLETTVETLVTGYKATRNTASDKDVSLWFDGDRLEEHVTMEDAEIDDMDTIEVHIK